MTILWKLDLRSVKVKRYDNDDINLSKGDEPESQFNEVLSSFVLFSALDNELCFNNLKNTLYVFY